MNQRLRSLSDAGVSVWLDDLSRERLTSGDLSEKIAHSSVVGVTTNPTIFAAAMQNGADYMAQLRQLGDVDPSTAIKQLWSTDVAQACDLFNDIYISSQGYDGRVSIEVDPRLAFDAPGTIAQAIELHGMVGRENVLIKIPATKEGLQAIRTSIGNGISVNVTLIFSVRRYEEVMDAYLAGLEDAVAAGRDLSKIHSVASLFVSRVDLEVNKRLEAIGGDKAKALRDKAGIANIKVAFATYEEVFAAERFAALAGLGANRQRPLWASTGTKDPNLSDTYYVTGLVARGVVNTLPEKTLNAFADHGEVGPSIEGTGPEGVQVLDQLDAIGVDLDDVFAVLEDEGVSKFEISWDEVVSSVERAQEQVKPH